MKKSEATKEREANEFAMALLMPESFLRADLKGSECVSYEELDALARRYQVTSELIAVRLLRLGHKVELT